MVLAALGLTASSRLLDIGSAYGRFCVHAALAAPRGAMVTGVEVGKKRAELASAFVDTLTAEHADIMLPVRDSIKLVCGNILDHLPELFAHSHLFIFDGRFTQSAWCALAYLLSYLAGVTGQVIISCQDLAKVNSDLVRGRSVPLELAEVMGSSQSFTAHVYTVDSAKKRCHTVEAYPTAAHRLAVRAVRALRAGQTIMRVEGSPVTHGWFNRQKAVAKREAYPYLTGLPALDRPGERTFLLALDVTRYIRRSTDTQQPCNVTVVPAGTEVYVVAVCDIPCGAELVMRSGGVGSEDERLWLVGTFD